MAAVSAVIVLALVVTLSLSDLHPVARAAGRTLLMKGAREKRLRSGVELHRVVAAVNAESACRESCWRLQLARGCWRGIRP